MASGKFDKQIFRWSAAVIAVLIAVFVIFRMPDNSVKSHQFGIARDFILFTCSTVVTWVVSSWFSRKESNEKIDTIAERSFEKMAMLTLQIERAKKFLVDTIKLSQSEADKVDASAGLLAYKHRINGSIATLDQISTSNDTFRADWLGVVSPEMKQTLSAKVEALASLPAVVSELSRGQSDGSDSGNDGTFEKKIETVEREVAGAGRLIDELKSRKRTKEPVAEILQAPDLDGTPFLQKGTLKISVQRLTFRATGTGSLKPHMHANPEVTVKLVSWPDSTSPEALRYPVGVGTNFNFNIGLMSGISGVSLPFGDYVFEYEAKCDAASA